MRADLVVHGPLTALLLVQLLQSELSANHPNLKIKSFDYRATKPLFVDREIRYCGKWKGNKESGGELELFAVDDEGDVAMKGTAVVE